MVFVPHTQKAKSTSNSNASVPNPQPLPTTIKKQFLTGFFSSPTKTVYYDVLQQLWLVEALCVDCCNEITLSDISCASHNWCNNFLHFLPSCFALIIFFIVLEIFFCKLNRAKSGWEIASFLKIVVSSWQKVWVQTSEHSIVNWEVGRADDDDWNADVRKQFSYWKA